MNGAEREPLRSDHLDELEAAIAAVFRRSTRIILSALALTTAVICTAALIWR